MQQLQLHPLHAAWKYGLAAPQGHRIHHQAVFVDQPCGGESAGQFGVAKNVQDKMSNLIVKVLFFRAGIVKKLWYNLFYLILQKLSINYFSSLRC